jgi:hypothetical protein
VLMLLERLPPLERAVYVLREAFTYSHNEIAEILDISVSASQQHALRARRHVAAGRNAGRVDHEAARRIVEAFVDAASSGRTERLVALLTDDATAVSDGAGVLGKPWIETVPARIAATFRAAFKPTPAKRRQAGGTPSIHAGIVNGTPAMIAVIDERVAGVVVLDPRGDKVAAIHGIAHQASLTRATQQWLRNEHGEPLIERW